MRLGGALIDKNMVQPNLPSVGEVELLKLFICGPNYY